MQAVYIQCNLSLALIDLRLIELFETYLRYHKMDEGYITLSQTDRQTDRQTNTLAPYTGVCGFFLSVKFATYLLASLAGG